MKTYARLSGERGVQVVGTEGSPVAEDDAVVVFGGVRQPRVRFVGRFVIDFHQLDVFARVGAFVEETVASVDAQDQGLAIAPLVHGELFVARRHETMDDPALQEVERVLRSDADLFPSFRPKRRCGASPRTVEAAP